MKWWEALRIWNEKRGDGMYCQVKKGTPEHAEVRAIQQGGAVKGGKKIKPKIDVELTEKVKEAVEKKHPFFRPREKKVDFVEEGTQKFSKEELKKFAEIRRAKKAEKAAKIAAFVEKLKGKKREKVMEFLKGVINTRKQRKAELMTGEGILAKHIKEVEGKDGKDAYYYIKTLIKRLARQMRNPEYTDDLLRKYWETIVSKRLLDYEAYYLKSGEMEKKLDRMWRDLYSLRSK